eukprot:gb/GECH01014955.1/.p1 GENE.gb/GECH01014955.1/~~gb/GECH01014955.1/.p1  ORF type:complete len:1446 (+),score=208.71 gb/GECH01014955.1/:1-4338(+)
MKEKQWDSLFHEEIREPQKAKSEPVSELNFDDSTFRTKRVYCQRSLFLFNLDNPIRKLCILLIETTMFDRLILFLILLNCVFLALYDPVNPDSQRNEIVHISEMVFAIIFLIEAIIKILAMGFVWSKKTYLRDPWNVLDFIIVISGVLVFLPVSANFSGLRVVRLLRPLRALSSIPEVRVIVIVILSSIPMLGNAILLFCFFVVVYGIIGVRLWAGVLHRRCYDIETQSEVLDPTRVCSTGSFGRTCPAGYTCLEKAGTLEDFAGTAGFDNILSAALIIFQSTTMEGWVGVNYTLMDASSPFVVIYFITLILIGTHFITNLAMVIITEFFAVKSKQTETASKGSSFQLKRVKKGASKWLELLSKTSLIRKWKQNLIRKTLEQLVHHKSFKITMMSLIVINTVLLCIEHFGMPVILAQILAISNYFFTGAFTIEVLTKIFALGVRKWMQDYFNIFDAIIVVASIIEVVVSLAIGSVNLDNPSAQQGTGLTALRALRLLRIFKLAKIWKSMQELLEAVMSSLKSAATLSIFLVLIVFVYALAGMQLFGGLFGSGDDRPRHHFDSLFWAGVTVFQVLSTENWDGPMYDSMKETSPFASLFFISLFIIGNYIIINIYVGVVFDSLREKEEKKKTANSLSFMYKLRSWRESRHKTRRVFPSSTRMENYTKNSTGKKTLWNKLTTRDYSLGFIPATNPFRKYLNKIVDHRFFEWFILCLILVSCVSLAIENPHMLPNDPIVIATSWINDILSILFFLEALIKIIAKGFILHRSAYLRDTWNILDFSIAVTSFVSLFIEGSQVQVVQLFRLLRALRPLRFITHSKGMKVVIDALLESIFSILNVTMVAILIIIVFGIIGVQLFAGKFYSCTDPDITTKDACLNSGNEWINAPAHFDNIYAASLALFEMTTCELWLGIMYRGIDARSHTLAPERDHSPWRAIYFIAFIIFGSFFVTNLFTGVLIDNYYKQKEKKDGYYLLSTQQKRWVETQKLMLNDKIQRPLIPPSSKWRSAVFHFVQHRLFDWFIITIICLNTILMTTYHYEQPEYWSQVLRWTNVVFTGIFFIEMVLKIIGLGLRGYFRDIWNIIDFIVVIISLPSLANLGDWIAVFQLLRVARIIRLVRFVPGLKILINTLIISIPSLLNVASLLALIFFIYAVLGMRLFGRVKRGEFITKHANFENIGYALLTLFRATTGEDWNGIMYECEVQEPNCSDKLGNCGSPWMSQIYWISFTIIGMYVLLNLFVAVILENFSTVTNQEGGIKQEDLDKFNKIWCQYDPESTNRIPAAKLPLFLYDLGPPLGIDNTHTRKDIMNLITKLNISEVEGRVHYYETLIALAQNNFGVELPAQVAESLELMWAKRLPPPQESSHSLPEVYAALRVQAAWRQHKERQRHQYQKEQSFVAGGQVEERDAEVIESKQISSRNNLNLNRTSSKFNNEESEEELKIEGSYTS